MQRYFLITILLALLSQQLNWSTKPTAEPLSVVIGYLTLHMILLVMISVVSFLGFKAMRAGQHFDKAHRSAIKLMEIAQLLALMLFITGIAVIGWPRAIAELIGEWSILWTFVITLPTLIIPFWSLFSMYPMDALSRTRSMVMDSVQMNSGTTPAKVWTRAQFMTTHLRIQILPILIPLILIILVSDLIDFTLQDYLTYLFITLLQLLAAVIVIFVAPVMMMSIFHTEPLEDGPTREKLNQILNEHQVKVRDIRRWITFHMIFNGAVTGFFGRLRYILLTDVLLDEFSPDQVEAVMAHEIGHVKHHHLLWMLLGITASISAAMLMINIGLIMLGSVAQLVFPEAWGYEDFMNSENGNNLYLSLLAVGSVVLWIPLFGWMSRRFERQADAFAAKHLSRMIETREGITTTPRTIHPDASRAMATCLLGIAEMNNIPAKKHTWRHGSIQWRVNYLESLVGQPVDSLPIDHQMKRVNLLMLIIFILGLFLEVLNQLVFNNLIF